MLKKVIVIVVLLAIYLGIEHVQAPKEAKRIDVDLIYVVDGDTMYFNENGQEAKYRLLMVDTPEATTEIEPYGIEATNYAKDLLVKAKTIQIEYQEDNELEDQYGRKLVWVFVDDQLLQVELAKVGYVKEKLYDNGGNYTYRKEIKKALSKAKENKVGLYQE